MTRKSLFLTSFLALLAALFWSLPVAATDVSGLVTADNYFTLYYGDASGTNLSQLASGSDWSQPQATRYK